MDRWNTEDNVEIISDSVAEKRKYRAAIFPVELAEKVITYYSFEDDVILDPFAGSGTVGLAATKLSRRFVLIEKEARFVNLIRKRVVKWLGKDAADVLCLNCPPINVEGILL